MWQAGSSPHARGAQCHIVRVRCLRGIIPACAGSTKHAVLSAAWSRDHPRMRGEHEFTAKLDLIKMGSSPHARGARRKVLAVVNNYGIIPACAGSTVAPNVRMWCREDHPRMRGEHAASYPQSRSMRGSSPHARGAPRRPVRSPGRLGIIPACAGSTLRIVVNVNEDWDHPRMRGEHAAVTFAVTHGGGSSPHARGARRTTALLPVAPGIIPACAGSTC